MIPRGLQGLEVNEIGGGESVAPRSVVSGSSSGSPSDATPRTSEHAEGTRAGRRLIGPPIEPWLGGGKLRGHVRVGTLELRGLAARAGHLAEDPRHVAP